MHYLYLLFLITFLAGLVLADYKSQLVFFPQKTYILNIFFISIGFFLIWDIDGIVSNVFATNQDWVSGLYIGTPNLPIEEFLFLTMLTYVTLMTWSIVCSRTS